MNVNRSPAELCSIWASPVTGKNSMRRKYHMDNWTSISWGFEWWRYNATSVFSFCLSSIQPEVNSVGHHCLQPTFATADGLALSDPDISHQDAFYRCKICTRSIFSNWNNHKKTTTKTKKTQTWRRLSRSSCFNFLTWSLHIPAETGPSGSLSRIYLHLKAILETAIWS